MRGRFYLLCLACMASGVVAGRYAGLKWVAALAASAAAAGMLAAAHWRGARVVAIPVVFLLVGIALMSGVTSRIKRGALPALAERRLNVKAEGRVVSTPSRKGELTSFFMEVRRLETAGSWSAVRERVQVRVESNRGPRGIYPGVSVRARGGLVPSGRSEQWLIDRGAGCILHVREGGLDECGPPPDPVSRLVEAARTRVSEAYREVFDEETAGLMEGVTLSKLDGLDPGLLEDLRRCGLSHIVAVSGLHVGSAAMLTAALLGALGAGRRTRYAAASGMALLVLGASNFRPSAVRASLMALAGYGGRLTGRRYDPLSGLCIAGFLILGTNPRSLFDQGLQLSFAAALGIVLTSSGMGHGSRTRSLLAVCAGAQLGILPLLLARGEPFPVTAVAANLLVVPVTGLLLMTGWGVAALVPLSPAAGRLAAVLPGSAAGYVTAVVGVMARVPLTGPAGKLLSASSFLLYSAALVWTVSRARTGRGMFAPAAACALAVFLALATCLPTPGAAADRVVILDVGEGDAILLTDSTGAAVLIDGGPDERLLRRKLDDRGVRKLDLVVLSHPHADHAAGLAGVAESMPVGRILEPGVPSLSADYRRLKEASDTRHIPRTKGREGLYLRVSEATALEVLYAPEDSQAEAGDLNECSLVILARLSGMKVLLCGDIGPDGIKALLGTHPDLESDVLKVPHHGASESASPELLSATRPLVAAISAGEDNSFGHPSRRCVKMLEARGIPVARTDRDGDIVVSVSRGRIGLAKERR